MPDFQVAELSAADSLSLTPEEVRLIDAYWRAANYLSVDKERNVLCESEGDIGAPDARVHTFVVIAREDIEIASEVRRLLAN